ncbi:MAG: FtsX-like permease family protein [Desulfobacterales bacterium]
MATQTWSAVPGNRRRVGRQVVLPFGKSVEIAYKSLRVRFFRSLITTLSLVLAVSFFSYNAVGNDIADGLLASGRPEIRQRLIRAGYDIQGDALRVERGGKQRWILVLSLLVCTVGILNAQLMAVTERFREIGTMKCLGALDRFVLRLFLLEAAMMGFVGSAAGAVIGALFALAAGVLRFGTAALACLPFAETALSLLSAAGIGLALSLLGVLYPAWVAARMLPVEAMRVET